MESFLRNPDTHRPLWRASAETANRSEGRWRNTYTMSYSSPTQKAKPPPPPSQSSHPPVRDSSPEDDDVIIEDTSGDEESSLPPALYIPLPWSPHVHFEQAKVHVLNGWGRLWRVVEIILHWPLPVEDS